MTIDVMKAERDLILVLTEIANIDARPDEFKDYEARYPLVYKALSLALDCGFEAGVRLDSVQGTDWPVVYIQLPTGQISWHQPEHPKQWDGHTPGEKHLRVWRWIDGRLQRPRPNAKVYHGPGVNNQISAGSVTGTVVQTGRHDGPVVL